MQTPQLWGSWRLTVAHVGWVVELSGHPVQGWGGNMSKWRQKKMIEHFHMWLDDERMPYLITINPECMGEQHSPASALSTKLILSQVFEWWWSGQQACPQSAICNNERRWRKTNAIRKMADITTSSHVYSRNKVADYFQGCWSKPTALGEVVSWSVGKPDQSR